MATLVRWTNEEMATVASYALALMSHDKRLGAVQAFDMSQRSCLPKNRFHGRTTFVQMARKGRIERALDAARATASTVPLPAVDPKQEHPERGDKVMWTLRERTLVAREVQKLQAAGHQGKLVDLMFQVQSKVLDPTRHRHRHSIYATLHARREYFEEAVRNIWTLPPEEPEPAPMPEPAQAPPEPAEPPQAPPPASAAPIPPVNRQQRLSEAAKVFGETVMGALDVLLATHASLLMQEVHARLETLADEVTSKLGGNIRSLVHTTIERELGPVPDDPARPNWAPAPAPAAPSVEPTPRKLPIDVVGLTGHPIEEVRRAFNGDCDIRFIDPEHVGGWTPRTHSILAVRFISHKAEDKCNKHGVKPIRVNGAGLSVIHAIRALRREAGFPDAVH